MHKVLFFCAKTRPFIMVYAVILYTNKASVSIFFITVMPSNILFLVNDRFIAAKRRRQRLLKIIEKKVFLCYNVKKIFAAALPCGGAGAV